jgi:multiple sugar transport system permease protein/cellobiose transport system permease protein
MTKTVQRILLYVILAAVTIISIAPFYFMILMSTYRTQQLGEVLSLRSGGYFLQNLETVMKSGFLLYYWNSIKVAVAFTVISVLLCALAGYGFAKFQFKFRNPLYVFVVASIMVPAQLGLIGYVIQMRQMHLIGTQWPLILGDIASCFGVFWLTEYISMAVPHELLDAARIDGCNEIRLFFQVVLPITQPALATFAIIQFVFSWNNYLRPLMTISNPDLYTVPLGIASLSTRYQTNYAAQITALSLGTIPTLIVFILGSRSFIRSLTSGAVKG